MPRRQRTAGAAERVERLRRLNLSMLVLLLVQFLLGVSTNLYVTIPSQHPGAHASNYFAGVMNGLGWVVPNGAVVLAAHAALGMALIVVGLAVLARSFSSHHGGVIWASLIGVLAIIGAAFNGASFLNYNKDVSSLIMSLLFALAVACYVLVGYLVPQRAAGSR